MAARFMQVQVDLNQQTMPAHNVSPQTDVLNAVSAQDLDPTGRRREARQFRLERRVQRKLPSCSNGSTTCR